MSSILRLSYVSMSSWNDGVVVVDVDAIECFLFFLSRDFWDFFGRGRSPGALDADETCVLFVVTVDGMVSSGDVVVVLPNVDAIVEVVDGIVVVILLVSGVGIVVEVVVVVAAVVVLVVVVVVVIVFNNSN